MENARDKKQRLPLSLPRALERCHTFCCDDNRQLERLSDEVLAYCRQKAASIVTEIDRAMTGGSTDAEEEESEAAGATGEEAACAAPPGLMDVCVLLQEERETQEKQIENLRKRCRRLSKASTALNGLSFRQAKRIRALTVERESTAQTIQKVKDLLLGLQESLHESDEYFVPEPAPAAPPPPAAPQPGLQPVVAAPRTPANNARAQPSESRVACPRC